MSPFADEFPSHPINLVVPFAAGGLTDSIARLVGQKISNAIGQSVIIENKPGGAAQIAAVYVKNARPDGHTLFVADIGSHAINPSLYSKLPYDPVKDFEPISLMVESTHVLVVPVSHAPPAGCGLCTRGGPISSGWNNGADASVQASNSASSLPMLEMPELLDNHRLLNVVAVISVPMNTTMSVAPHLRPS